MASATPSPPDTGNGPTHSGHAGHMHECNRGTRGIADAAYRQHIEHLTPRISIPVQHEWRHTYQLAVQRNRSMLEHRIRAKALEEAAHVMLLALRNMGPQRGESAKRASRFGSCCRWRRFPSSGCQAAAVPVPDA